jgi:hypothetical protein
MDNKKKVQWFSISLVIVTVGMLLLSNLPAEFPLSYLIGLWILLFLAMILMHYLSRRPLGMVDKSGKTQPVFITFAFAIWGELGYHIISNRVGDIKGQSAGMLFGIIFLLIFWVVCILIYKRLTLTKYF